MYSKFSRARFQIIVGHSNCPNGQTYGMLLRRLAVKKLQKADFTAIFTNQITHNFQYKCYNTKKNFSAQTESEIKIAKC